MTCSTCVWSRLAIFVDDGGPEPGLECWRYPPTAVVHNDEVLAVRPQVDGDDTCGEWESSE